MAYLGSLGTGRLRLSEPPPLPVYGERGTIWWLGADGEVYGYPAFALGPLDANHDFPFLLVDHETRIGYGNLPDNERPHPGWRHQPGCWREVISSQSVGSSENSGG